MPRIFIAINLPSEIKQGLEQIRQEIAQSFPMEAGGIAKWVSQDNWHITLLFLGEVRVEQLPRLCQIVQTALSGWKSFLLRINKVCFDNQKSPRLIWAELSPSQDLNCLNQMIKDNLLSAKILRVNDSRPFNGHITLARIRSWQWQRIAIEERPQIDYDLSLNFTAESIEIIESKLKRTGSEYKVIQSVILI